MQISQSTSEKRYTYAELEGSAREKARQHYIEHWLHDAWYEHLYDEFKGYGKADGFEIDDINFSGFWSQGDGAMWTGDIYLPDFIRAKLPESIGRDCWLWLIEDGWVHDRLPIYRQSHHYSHSHTMGIGNLETYGHETETLKTDCILKGAPVEAVWALIMNDRACNINSVEELEEMALQEARQFAEDMYTRLREAYEYECSEESVADCYNINEVLFNEEGVILK